MKFRAFVFLFILLPGVAFAQAAPSLVPGVAPGATGIDLSTIETQILQLLGMVLLGLIGLATQRLSAWLKQKGVDAQKAEMDDVAMKAVTYGITQAQGMIKAHGWDNLEVRNVIVGQAARYAVAQFPGAMASAGYDISTPSAQSETASKLTGILTRKFPDAVTQAAQSPATPAAPAAVIPPGSVVAVVASPAAGPTGATGATGP